MKILSVIAVLVGLFGIYHSANSLNQNYKVEYKLLESPPLSEVDTRWIHVLTLGHKPLYDDIATIWLLQILTDKNLKQEDPKELHKVITSVVRHKPKLETTYLMPCFILFIDHKYPEGCESITRAGMEAFPESWIIPVTQAYVFGNELGDDGRAGLYYKLASSKPDAPKFLNSLATKLLEGFHFDSEDALQTLKEMGKTESGKNLSKILMQTKQQREPNKKEEND